MTGRATYGHALRHRREQLTRSLAGASSTPFWLDGPRPAATKSVTTDESADLLVIGGGFCGLWTALQAKERDPDRDVILIDAKRIAWAASGRNGGFVEASLTHGVDNGVRHFGQELAAIATIARANFDELRSTLDRYGIDAEWEEHGVLTVATEPHQVDSLLDSGDPFLAGADLRSVTRSPVALAATMETEDVALVHPAKLAFGLLRACLSLGVRVFENTPALRISNAGDVVKVETREGSVTALQVALATNGFRPLLKRNALLTVPVYDYVIVTEPLTDQQLADIGWTDRFGMTDSSRQFHYYRKTADNRILWGGYDAVYHRGRKIRSAYEQRPETFERLADHFFTTFPTLVGTRFTHAWGGMIDMSTNFVPFQGLAMNGKVSYSLGYTGLGVAATRFGAAVMLDLLAGKPTPRTALRFVTTKPFPIPPEPLAYPAIQTMRSAIARSDENGGRDGFLIKALEVLGIGFDS
jgi:glycine/D-amino acid oxidase-like deaminating enzyme